MKTAEVIYKNGPAHLLKRLVLVIFFVSVLFLPSVSLSHERGEHAGEVVTLPAGAVVKTDYFAAGERVEISGTVDGDVYAAGGHIIVDGTINGDLLAAGGTVVVSGKVRDDVRVVGGDITVDGTVGRNLTAAGGKITLARSSKVAGSAAVAGADIDLLGPVGGDVRVAGAHLTVSDSIKGSLTAAVKELRLGSKAAVAGDLIYWSHQPAHIDPDAKVSGKVTYRDTYGRAERFTHRTGAFLAGAVLALKVISFVSTLAISLFLVYLLPNFSRSSVATLRARPMASLGTGLLMLILIPALSFVLVATVVGIPVALILMALYLISLYLSKLVVIYWAGVKISERGGRTPGKGWPLIMGLVIYTVITLIPFAGWAAAFLIMLFGLGSVVLTARDGYGAARENKTL